MTEYDWLNFITEQKEGINKIRNEPIVLKFGVYNCFVENCKIHYFKYVKKTRSHKIPVTTCEPFQITNSRVFVGFLSTDTFPTNPQENDIYYDQCTNMIYAYVDSCWTRLIESKEEFVSGGIGNRYIFNLSPASYYLQKETEKIETEEYWSNEEFSREQWLKNI